MRANHQLKPVFWCSTADMVLNVHSRATGSKAAWRRWLLLPVVVVVAAPPAAP
jgi:hypothetical protein